MVSTIASSLHAALSAVCPIIGVSIGNRADKGTWSYTVAEGATTQQIADAASVFAAFDAGQAAEDARRLAALRAEAKAYIASSKDAQAKKDRCTIAILLDEINDLRGWIRSCKTAARDATNFADFKTRVAALDNMPARTMTQARAKYEAMVDSGKQDDGMAD